MTQREEFEIWHCVTQASSLKRDVDGEYVNAFTNARWEAWQAAMQAQPERAPLTESEISKLVMPYGFSSIQGFDHIKAYTRRVEAYIKQGGQHG